MGSKVAPAICVLLLLLALCQAEEGSGDSLRVQSPTQLSDLSSVRGWLDVFEKSPDISLRDVNTFTSSFLTTFLKPEFCPPLHEMELLLKKGPVLSNMIWLSRNRTTDRALDILRRQRRQLYSGRPLEEQGCLMLKQLVLTSARNHVRYQFMGQPMPSHGGSAAPYSKAELLTALDMQMKGQTPPAGLQQIATEVNFWFSSYLRLFGVGLLDTVAQPNLQRVVADYSWWYTFDEFLNTVYYAVSYVAEGPRLDKPLKAHINAILQNTFAHERPPLEKDVSLHRGNMKYIALISQFWFERHSVYRTLFPYLEALVEAGYTVDMLVVGSAQYDTDRSLFSDVKEFSDPSDLQKSLDIMRHVQKRRYGIIWYPSVGMDWPSMYLSNRRLAPLQLASPGHSVSTYGAMIDFFLSGEDAEDLSPVTIDYVSEDGQAGSAATLAEGERAERTKAATVPLPWAVQHYSEQLVLMKGTGVVHRKPRWAVAPPAINRPDPAEGPVIINAPFSAQKVNLQYLRLLRRVVNFSEAAREGGRGLLFRFFPYLTSGLQRAVFLRGVEAALGVRRNGTAAKSAARHLKVAVEVFGDLEYSAYMSKMAEGHLTIEANHYGGCNTVVDSLLLGVPIVLWEGKHWYNRIGSAILRSAAPELAGDLITTSATAFAEKLGSLIDHPEELERVTDAVREVDLDATIFGEPSREEAAAFPEVVEFLSANYERLSREANQRRRWGLPPLPVFLGEKEALWKEEGSQQRPKRTGKEEL